MAKISCTPTVVNVTVTLARLPTRVAPPRDRKPSVNCKVPVGAEPVTIAMKVTACPGREGLLLLATSRDELARTVTETAVSGEVLGAKSCALAGVNVAVRRCDPDGRLVTRDAVPAEVTVVTLPRIAVPLS